MPLDIILAKHGDLEASGLFLDQEVQWALEGEPIEAKLQIFTACNQLKDSLHVTFDMLSTETEIQTPRGELWNFGDIVSRILKHDVTAYYEENARREAQEQSTLSDKKEEEERILQSTEPPRRARAWYDY